ncbi:unnamed protein product, partial [Nesidiocoris tenuis]
VQASRIQMQLSQLQMGPNRDRAHLNLDHLSVGDWEGPDLEKIDLPRKSRAGKLQCQQHFQQQEKQQFQQQEHQQQEKQQFQQQEK